MTAAFECEVRFRVADIDAFHRDLAALGAVLREPYAFTDHYYRSAPAAGGEWTAGRRALRIREHHVPDAGSEVLLTDVEMSAVQGLTFKRSRFPEGKVRLYAGSPPDCRAVIEALGFVSWTSVRKRDGRLFDIPDFGSLVTEHVEGIGWMCEVEQEGSDATRAVEAIRSKLARLGVRLDEVTGEPIAALIARGPRDSAREDAIAVPAGAKVYFCGAIRGGRERQPLYRAIVDFLQDRGYEVLTTHVAAPDVLRQEWREGVTARDIYERDLRWLAECDCVVAEVSTPSLGVGVEITEAQRLGKPILALCHAGVSLSAMVAGNPAVTLITYQDEGELRTHLAGALGRPDAGRGNPDVGVPHGR